MAASSWGRIGAADRVKAKESRIKAKERAKQARKDELVGYKPGDREYQEITRRHQAEDWDKRQKQRHAEYDRQYGAGAQRKQVKQMEQFARRREQDADFQRRVEAGEVDFQGDLASIKSGKAWDKGQIDAYNDYSANRNKYKKNPQSFDYASYFPGDKKLNRPKPSYESYMGQYYDPDYKHDNGRPGLSRNWQYGSQEQKPQYGNPYR